jgi:hypothetical protein
LPLEFVFGIQLQQKLLLPLLSDALSVSLQYSRLKHARGKDLEHALALLDPLGLGNGFAGISKTPRPSAEDYSLILLVIVILGLVLQIADVLLFARRPRHGKLLHHFQELLPIVLEQVVSDGKDTSWCQMVNRAKCVECSRRVVGG